jgi:hypothetical protein
VWHCSLQQFCLLKIKIERMKHKWNFADSDKMCPPHWEFNTHCLCESWVHFSLGDNFLLWIGLLQYFSPSIFYWILCLTQNRWYTSFLCKIWFYNSWFYTENLTHTVFVKAECTSALENIFCSELSCYSISGPHQYSIEFYAWHRIDTTFISYVRYDFTILLSLTGTIQ